VPIAMTSWSQSIAFASAIFAANSHDLIE